MWSYSSNAKHFQECNAQNFFLEIKEQSIAFVDISWLKANPAKIFTNGDLMLSPIPHYVIKKRRPRGALHGKTELQKKHFVAHNARRRCIKKNYDGIHYRCQRDTEKRDSQLKIGSEGKCIEMDKSVQVNHSYGPSSEECERYRKHWCILLNKSGKHAPMRLRSEFRTTVRRMHRPPSRIWRRAT